MEDLYDKVLEQASDDEDQFKYRLMKYHHDVLYKLHIRGKINSFDLKRLTAEFAQFIIGEMSRKD